MMTMLVHLMIGGKRLNLMEVLLLQVTITWKKAIRCVLKCIMEHHIQITIQTEDVQH